ncbi:MAG: hypothetical protein MMC33_008305 [Icmadophila ericetorum]|nr:hypothetical protein [Icmadophila ericetorum]
MSATPTPTQYDQIATQYELIKTTPGDKICVSTNQLVLGNITGLRVLDLACGTGWWGRKLIEWGASTVVGIDISAPMIEVAKTSVAQNPALQSRLEFHVGDLTKPNVLKELDITPESFDLVHGAWLLNYASTPSELTAIFRTIASALKPSLSSSEGGPNTTNSSRFVALIPNILDQAYSFTNPFNMSKYGAITEPVAKIPHGWKTHLRTLTEPPVQFENYFLNETGLYERCAREGGLEIVRLEVVGPGRAELEAWPEGFWDDYVRRPGARVLVAVRAGESGEDGRVV